MKVKIGATVFDAEQHPIMIILNEKDKENIRNMGEKTRYCGFPETGYTAEQIREFMKLPEDNVHNNR